MRCVMKAVMGAGIGSSTQLTVSTANSRPHSVHARAPTRALVALRATTKVPSEASDVDTETESSDTRSFNTLVNVEPSTSSPSPSGSGRGSPVDWQARRNRLLKRKQKAKEQVTYKITAIASTLAVGSIAVVCTALRFYWHMEDNGEFPWVEFFSTLLLIGGGAVGMEFWAQWAHKELWHDNELGWALHKSHHEPRIGPFEANDVFAIINAVPAISLIFYGFITPNEIGGLCYGAGLGITLFGMSYMFVHDGLVHKRFPVGPLEQVPYFRRVAVAHKLHHTEKYNGVPWGLFLGPVELEKVGAKEELDMLVQKLGTGDIKAFKVPE